MGGKAIIKKLLSRVKGGNCGRYDNIGATLGYI